VRCLTIATEYNISPNTIYTWISQSANSDKDKQSMILENSRLKREKQKLIELIGRLTIDVSRLNKKKLNCYEILQLPKTDRISLAKIYLKQYPDTNKSLLATVLQLNRTSFYVISKMDLKDELWKTKIIELHKSQPFYGCRRVAIHFDLLAEEKVKTSSKISSENTLQSPTLSKNKAKRIMRKYEIFPIYRKPKFIVPAKLDDLGNPPQPIKNHLKQIVADNQLTTPNKIWSVDFTYIAFQGYFIYLATEIDSFAKDIVGHAISTNHNSNLVIKALDNAVQTHGIPEYEHGDQETEYTGEPYQNRLKAYGITQSLSAKSSPWQNGRQESFYNNFKLELPNPKTFQTEADLILAIHHLIHSYNHHRIHTTIKNYPSKFGLKCLAK
jgi:putative transposase